MRSGQTFFVGEGKRKLIGQAEMQRLVGIEERSGGSPKARQEP